MGEEVMGCRCGEEQAEHRCMCYVITDVALAPSMGGRGCAKPQHKQTQT